MPMYEYRCPWFHDIFSWQRDDYIHCSTHQTNAQRIWSFRTVRPFQPHFNHSVGAHVTSLADFDEKLKIAGEAQGASLARIDPGDLPRPTADDGIFDTQMRTLTDKGFVGDDGKVHIDDAGEYVRKR